MKRSHSIALVEATGCALLEEPFEYLAIAIVAETSIWLPEAQSPVHPHGLALVPQI